MRQTENTPRTRIFHDPPASKVKVGRRNPIEIHKTAHDCNDQILTMLFAHKMKMFAIDDEDLVK